MTRHASRPRVAVVSFGLGGHSLEYVDAEGRRSSLSGYDTPEQFETAIGKGEYSKYHLEGAPVLDKRAILTRDPQLAVVSPMVDPVLPPGSYRLLGEEARLAAGGMLPGLEGEFLALAQRAVQDPRFGGLDYVSADLYVAWWDKHGAKMGRVEGGRIVWTKADWAPFGR